MEISGDWQSQPKSAVTLPGKRSIDRQRHEKHHPLNRKSRVYRKLVRIRLPIALVNLTDHCGLHCILEENGIQLSWTPHKDIQSHFIEVIFTNPNKCGGGPFRTHRIYQQLGIAQVFYQASDSEESMGHSNGSDELSLDFSCRSSCSAWCCHFPIVYFHASASESHYRSASRVFCQHARGESSSHVVHRHRFDALHQTALGILSQRQANHRGWLQWRYR